MKYKYLIFDLDDTLNNDYENRRYAIKEVLRYLNKEISDEVVNEFLKFDNKYWSDRANGSIQDLIQFETVEEKVIYRRSQRFVLFFQGMTFDKAKEVNMLYLEKLKENIVAIDGALDIIKYVHEKGYKIVIATNGPTVAIGGKLEKIGIDKYVDCIFASEEVRLYETKKRVY